MRSQRGFSLLEVIVALGVLAVILLATASFLHGSSELDSVSHERIMASQAAASRLEDVLAEPWSTLASRHGETFSVQGEIGNSLVADRLPAGAGRSLPGRVDVAATGRPGLLRIEVSVLWRSRVGDIEYRLRTLVAEH